MHAVVLLQQRRCLMFCQLSGVAFDTLKQVLEHAAARVRKLGAQWALLTCSVDLRHLACTLASFQDGGCGQAVCACAVYQACTSAAVGRRPFSARKARHLVAAAGGVATGRASVLRHAIRGLPRRAGNTATHHVLSGCQKRAARLGLASFALSPCGLRMVTSERG